ncbi:MAG: polysaccharide deacetylase family protein [Candidatus Spechtbacterales bacterium]
MPKKRILTTVIFLGVTGALFFLFITNKTPVMDDSIPKASHESDVIVAENSDVAEPGNLPARLDPEFPDKIDNPYNPCYSLDVEDEIKEKRKEFLEHTNRAKVENEQLLKKNNLPLEVFRGSEHVQSVALTIDTGVGGAEGIAQLLDIAEHYDIGLIFFVTGCWALENPELLQEIFTRGHGIGNHSLTHLNLARASDIAVEREIGETDRILEEILGFHPALFRKPQYAGGERITKFAAEHAKISVQGYPDLGDTAGWHSASTPEGVLNRVKRGTASGAIWVFHNLSLSDLLAFEDIIRFHLEEGYELVGVEEML